MVLGNVSSRPLAPAEVNPQTVKRNKIGTAGGRGAVSEQLEKG
jgi:hypothetical protein